MHLAHHGRDGSMQAKDLAEATSVPLSYMRKVLHELTRAGVLRSTRGKLGGFRLARAPDRISLLQVVARIEGLTERRRCILGRPKCSDRDPCPMHESWKAIADRVAAFFSGTTLADIVEDVVTKPRRRRG